MSRLLLLCMVLGMCAACIPGDSPTSADLPVDGWGPQQAMAAQSFGFSTGLVAGQPPSLLFVFSQAQRAWIDANGIAAGDLPAGDLPAGWSAPPDGTWPELESQELLELATWLHRGIWFEGDWSARGLRTALQGLQMTFDALGGNLEAVTALLGITGQQKLVYRVCAGCFATGNHFSQPGQHRVTFDSNPDLVSFLHETGHVVDYYLARGLQVQVAWWSESGFLGLGWKKQVHQSGEAGAYYLDTDEDAPHSEYSPREDFADTFAAWVLEENGQPLPHGWRDPSLRRVRMLGTVPSAILE